MLFGFQVARCAIRAVTHLDVSRRGIDRALNVVREVATNLNEEKVDGRE